MMILAAVFVAFIAGLSIGAWLGSEVVLKLRLRKKVG